jgi:hypothetical protein
MPWSGGSYTKGNNATGGWTGDASLGIGIEAGRHDTQDNDFATGINQCLNKDGSNPATGPLNAGGFKLTNAADGTAATDATTLRQVQAQAYIWCGTSGGSANAQTLTPSPAISAYAAGQMFRFIAGFTSTGALTLQVSGLASPVTCLMKGSKTAFTNAAYIVAGLTYEAFYDGTNFLISDLMDFSNYTNDAAAARVKLYKSRGSTAGTNTIVQNGDSLGQIDFYGANGTGFIRGAYFNATVEGTPGATNDMPTALTFATTPDGSGTAIERMRITNAGRVGIGTVAPTNYFHITNNESNALNALLVQSNVVGDVGTAALVIAKRDAATTTSQSIVQFFTNGGAAGQGQITANGANAAAFGSFSDIRLKENVVELPSQLESICNLRPVEFDYKDGSGHQIGFIAQEVQVVYPDLVGENNGFLTLTDMNKNDARLIKAIQELNAKVEALEAQLAATEVV